MKMDSLVLENYRCFRETQDVPLAPLTLLVGENGTGKTSFLAMIRALWQIPFGFPSFRGEPYDLGSFGDIAHFRGGRDGQTDSFRGGFEFTAATRPSKKRRLSAVFEDVGTVAFPIARHLSMDDDRTWIDIAGGGSPRASLASGIGHSARRLDFSPQRTVELRRTSFAACHVALAIALEHSTAHQGQRRLGVPERSGTHQRGRLAQSPNPRRSSFSRPLRDGILVRRRTDAFSPKAHV